MAPTRSHTQLPSAAITLSAWNAAASPFQVFFSGGGVIPAGGGTSGSASGVAHLSFPNTMMMQLGIFSGMLGMVPGILPGANSGAVLPGLGVAFGGGLQGLFEWTVWQE